MDFSIYSGGVRYEIIAMYIIYEAVVVVVISGTSIALRFICPKVSGKVRVPDINTAVDYGYRNIAASEYSVCVPCLLKFHIRSTCKTVLSFIAVMPLL